MGASHHGNEFSPEDRKRQEAMIERFVQQVEGTAKRAYSAGRICAEDEGDIAAAIIVDRLHGRIVIDFGKPVTWFAMTEHDAASLIRIMIAKLREIATEPFTLEIP